VETGVACWFAYGDLVVDRLLGSCRSETAQIYCAEAEPPRPASVRLALGVPRDLPVVITDVPPRAICTLDRIHLQADGELVDVTGCPLAPDGLAIELTTYDLLAEDILRLDRLHKVYPEIRFEPALLVFLASAVSHLRSLEPSFEDLGLLIASHAPPGLNS
jgi:hypothetical protein